jgi:hypothetical protein
MGRQGSGPGEFLLPTQLRLTSDEIHIVDGRQLRRSRFDYTGHHIETAPLSVPAGITASSLYQFRDGSTLLQTIYRAAIGSPDHDPFVHVVHLGAGGTHRDTLATYEPAVILWFVPGQKAPWGGVPSGHGDTGTLAVSGDSLIALVDGVSGKATMRRVTGAGLGAPTTVDLGVRGRDFPEQLLVAIQDSIRRARKNTAIAVAGPAHLSALTGQVFFSADEELWVEITTDDSSDREWIRVNPTDGSTRRLRVPRAFSVRTARDKLIYGVWRDELDVETVRIYRLAEEQMNREPRHALNGR